MPCSFEAPEDVLAAGRLSSLGLSNGLLCLLNQQFTKLVCLGISVAPPLDVLAPIVGSVLLAVPLLLALIVLPVGLPQKVDVFLRGMKSSSDQVLGTAGRTVMRRNGQTEMSHAAAGMEAILLWA